MNKEYLNLIDSELYLEACELLSGKTDKQNLYWLSLIYSYKNMFDEELQVIKKALLHYPNWKYMLKRQEWHALADFNKMEARPSLNLDRNLENIPKNKTLESMCFVTGGDTKYFQIMYECLESIKATKYYNKIPIFIIDCGLKDEEKTKLRKLLSGGCIKDPGWCLDIKEFHKINKQTGESYALPHLINSDKSVANKAFLNKIFPGYSYYFWINSNYWVQDENSLDAIIKICEKQSIAYPDASHGNARTLKYAHWNRLKYIPKKYQESAFSVRHGCDAVFCITSQLLNECQEIIKDFVKQNNGIYFYYFFEFIQSYLSGEHNLNPDVPVKYYAHINHMVAPGGVGYQPIVKDDNPHVIYKQQNPNHPIGIIRPIGFHDYNHTLFVQDKENVIVANQIGSTRYRTLPWKDRSEIKNKLLQKPEE